MRRKLILVLLAAMLIPTIALITVTVAAQEAPGEGAGANAGLIAVGAGLAMAGAGIGAGYGIGISGAATVSASTERPEMFFRGFLIVALAEAVAVYGFIIAIILMGRM